MYFIIMGVAGSGKTTIASKLASRLTLPFKDADSFHPPENVAKMSRGEPLNDDDRQPWLEAIVDYINTHENVVVTCSALKQKYRTTLKKAKPQGRIIYLHGSEELIFSRMSARKDHFMPLSLLKSQLATLEIPTSDENILTVSIEGSEDEIVDRIVNKLSSRPL
jgi:gluconokinase